jgi:UDP-N-acetylglucosamine 4-epimerase
MKILVTGGAGFIGCNLVQRLLATEEVTAVRVLDNLATGSVKNIEPFRADNRFEFMEGDIRSYEACLQACEGIECHFAPGGAGFRAPLHLRPAYHQRRKQHRLPCIYCMRQKKQASGAWCMPASSSTYGDHPGLPKQEDLIGAPLSPYAVTKYVNELYAKVYASLYGMELIGLRYFNVFGPHQNPQGPYAAVIPLFIKAVLNNEPPVINGDGSHSRDFTFVANAVEANLCALFTTKKKP